jgi:hypothetical protein
MTRRPTSSSPLRRSRRGIATIELVMIFPVLVWLAVMVFTLGTAHLQKSSANIRSREQAWDLKEPIPANDEHRFARSVLIHNSITENRKSETVERQVKMPNIPGLGNAGRIVTGETTNSLNMGTWTDENPRVKMKDAIGQQYHPHLAPAMALLLSQRTSPAGIYQNAAGMAQIIAALSVQAPRGLADNARLTVESVKLPITVARSMKYYGQSGAFVPYAILEVIDWPMPFHGAFMSETGLERRSALFDKFY